MISNNRLIKITLHHFWHCFWQILIFQTTLKPIQVIIISLIYYSSSIFLWSFSYHICVVDFWPVCLHWSDQRSLILKLVIGCGRKLSVGHIQNGHKYLLPPQVCGKLRQGCRLGVHTCLLQLISLLDLKSSSSSSFKPSFVDFWLVCIIFIGSEFIDPETCPWVC